MSIELQLEKFRESYHSVRVAVYHDYLCYKCNKGMSDKAAFVANALIEKLNLDLVAISTSNFTKDSYIIQSVYSEI